MFSDYFTSASNPHHEELLKTMTAMQSDSDRDVRYFVSQAPERGGATDLSMNVSGSGADNMVSDSCHLVGSDMDAEIGVDENGVWHE